MLKLVKFTAKQVEKAGYCGPRGGSLSGTHYALEESGKGLCSIDGGRTVFMMSGPSGKRVMQSIIDAGGVVGEISYRDCI